MKTLEEIIALEQKHRCVTGQFGILACKEHIRLSQRLENKSYEDLLATYVKRANEDAFFNKTMVLACYELTKEIPAKDLCEKLNAVYSKINGSSPIIPNEWDYDKQATYLYSLLMATKGMGKKKILKAVPEALNISDIYEYRNK